MNEAPEYETSRIREWNLEPGGGGEEKKKDSRFSLVRSPAARVAHKCPIVDRRGCESASAHCRRPRRRSLTPLTTFYLKFDPKWGPLDKFPGFTASHPISRRQ